MKQELNGIEQELNGMQHALFKTVQVYEAMYHDLPDRLSYYKKEDYMVEGVDNNIENDCYLCQYSSDQMKLQCEPEYDANKRVCIYCPCTKYLGDRCYKINPFIVNHRIPASTVRWALKNIYIIARKSNTPCEFTYWNKVKYTGGK